MIELRGRGAIITGTRRFGATVARRLAHEGVRIALVYRSSKTEAEALQTELSPLTQVVLIQADLSDEAQVERVVQTAKAELGDVSFLVNLAFDYPRDPLDTLNAAAWDRGMAGAKANFLLAVHASRTDARRTRAPRKGHLDLLRRLGRGRDAVQRLHPVPHRQGRGALHDAGLRARPRRARHPGQLHRAGADGAGYRHDGRRLGSAPSASRR